MERPVDDDRAHTQHRPVPAPDMGAHLQMSVEVSSDAIIGADRRGAVIAWNPAAERLFRHTAREAIGQPLTSLIAPHAPDAEPLIAQALSGQEVRNERISLIGQTGATQRSLSIFVMHDANGAVNVLSVVIQSPDASHSEAPAAPAGPSLRSVMDRLPVAVFLIAPDERQTRLYASPAITAITGYSPQEFLMQSRQPGWHWTDAVHPLDRARVAAEDAQSIAYGESFQMEYRFVRKDGSVAWVRDIGIPIRDDGGEITNWMGVLLDITDEMEAARRQSHLAAIVEAAGDGILSVGRDGIIFSWNKGAERIYGYPAEEVLGQPVSMLWPPERASQIVNEIAPVWNGAVLNHYETVRMTKDGRRIPVSLSVFPIRNADGDIVATSSITHDLSPLRQAEAAERLRNRAMDAAQNGIVITDPTLPGHPIVDINPAFTRLTGYSREEVIGRNSRFLQGPDTDPEAVRRLQEAVAEGRDTTLTILAYRKDGTPFWNNLSLAAVYDANGELTHFVGELNDVTGRVHLEQELRAALAAAEAGNESKTLFLAMMSHELRTPLQSITGYADFLLDPRSEPLTEQQREDVLAISHGARRMQTLVGQLLELSRMDSGPLTIQHERVALKPIIDQVLRELAPQIAEKGLCVCSDVPVTTPDVAGDAGRIYQILSSLAGNAIKFTPRGSIQITVEPQGPEVAVHLRDTGVGIAAEQLHYIFEPFRQGHDGLTRPFEGAGLGLTVAERLARQMRGRITVQSEPGAGATFTVWLPRAVNQAPEAPGA
jgi:two-component system cell cycle sensor histidine kinase/response regulator CckA